MFQQKASTKRTVRGSTDTVFSRMAAFDILPRQQLVLHRKVHPYLQSERPQGNELPEQKKVPPFNFSRTKNISLPEYEFSPPARYVCAPSPCRTSTMEMETLALFRFDRHPASQILTGNEHHTRGHTGYPP